MNRIKTTQHPYVLEQRFLFGACFFLLMSLCLYMYFVCASVHHVVMRKDVDARIMEFTSTVGSLEAAYIEAQHAMSEDIALHKGFARAEEKIFINADTSTLVLNTAGRN